MERVRRVKNKNYTTISNTFLRDKNLSLKAKGFLGIVMSLPDDWDFSINGICAIIKEGRDAARSVVNELIRQDYCRASMSQDPETGKFSGMDYTFYEEPIAANSKEVKDKAKQRKRRKPSTASPLTDNPSTDSPHTDNPRQISTDFNKSLNKQNKERENNSHPQVLSENENDTKALRGVNTQSRLQDKKEKNSAKRERRSVWCAPTIEDVRAYFKENGFRSRADVFFYFYEAKGWDGIKSWQAQAQVWEYREKEGRPEPPEIAKKVDQDYLDYVKSLEKEGK